MRDLRAPAAAGYAFTVMCIYYYCCSYGFTMRERAGLAHRQCAWARGAATLHSKTKIKKSQQTHANKYALCCAASSFRDRFDEMTLLSIRPVQARLSLLQNACLPVCGVWLAAAAACCSPIVLHAR